MSTISKTPEEIPFANRKYTFYPNKFEKYVADKLGYWIMPAQPQMEEEAEDPDEDVKKEITAQYWDLKLNDEQNELVLLSKSWKRQGENLSMSEWESFKTLWESLEHNGRLILRETLPRKIALRKIIRTAEKRINGIIHVSDRFFEEIFFKYLYMDLSILLEPTIIDYIEKQKFKRNTGFLDHLKRAFNSRRGRKDPPAPKWEMDWVLVQSLLLKGNPFRSIAKDLQKNPIPGIKRWKENTLRAYAKDQKKKYLTEGLTLADLEKIAELSSSKTH